MITCGTNALCPCCKNKLHTTVFEGNAFECRECGKKLNTESINALQGDFFEMTLALSEHEKERVLNEAWEYRKTYGINTINAENDTIRICWDDVANGRWYIPHFHALKSLMLKITKNVEV